jgi:hypothetical protein
MSDNPIKKQGMRRGKAFWSQVRDAYVRGQGGDRYNEPTWNTLTEIAEQFDVNPTHLRERASQGGWKAARDEYRARTELEVRVARLEQRASDVRATGSTQLSLSRALNSQIAWCLNEIETLKSEGKAGVAFVAQITSMLSNIAERSQTVARRALDMPDSLHEERRKVEASLTVHHREPEQISPARMILRKAALLDGEAMMKALDAVDRLYRQEQPQQQQVIDAEAEIRALPIPPQ